MLTELAGVWEADGVMLTLVVGPDAVRVHQRFQTPDGAVQQALTLPLDGTPVTVGEASVHARWEDGLHVVLPNATIVRRLVEDTLVETVTQGTTVAEQVYRRSAPKQVMIYRRDLKMRKGKIAAQCAHGAMAVFFRRDQSGFGDLVIPLDGPMEIWSRSGFAKIVLSCDDEAALLEIEQLAKRAGLPVAVITDSGRTEFHGVPTRTVVAIGPAAVGEIDAITGRDGAVVCKLA